MKAIRQPSRRHYRQQQAVLSFIRAAQRKLPETNQRQRKPPHFCYSKVTEPRALARVSNDKDCRVDGPVDIQT
jgi:hypothetical protein